MSATAAFTYASSERSSSNLSANVPCTAPSVPSIPPASWLSRISSIAALSASNCSIMGVKSTATLCSSTACSAAISPPRSSSIMARISSTCSATALSLSPPMLSSILSMSFLRFIISSSTTSNPPATGAAPSCSSPSATPIVVLRLIMSLSSSILSVSAVWSARKAVISSIISPKSSAESIAMGASSPSG